MKHIRRLMFLLLIIAGIYFCKNYYTGGSIDNSGSGNLIKRPENMLVLVNREHSLSEDYVPDDLVKPEVRFTPDTSGEEEYMQDKAAKALEKLFSAADKKDIRLYCVSGYRSYDLQKSIYKRRVKSAGKQEADRYVARPGNSEHQTGLAMDLTNEEGAVKSLSEDFGSTNEGIWLKNNAYMYGFIIRYPKGCEDITGYNYEPWHIRYVGETAAKKIKQQDIVLEEFLKDYESAALGGTI